MSKLTLTQEQIEELKEQGLIVTVDGNTFSYRWANPNIDKGLTEHQYPEGYVLVPAEPTEAMQNVLVHYPSSHPVDTYKAMIQAAQESD